MRGDTARCARGHALGMPTACLLWANNLIFQKTHIFRKSLQICGQGMHPRSRPRPRHAAKTKATPYVHAAKAGACSSQGQGSPHGQAAKAKACLRACCQGQGHGSPHGLALAKAKARGQGHGMLAWARWHALGCRQQDLSMHAA